MTMSDQKDAIVYLQKLSTNNDKIDDNLSPNKNYDIVPVFKEIQESSTSGTNTLDQCTKPVESKQESHSGFTQYTSPLNSNCRWQNGLQTYKRIISSKNKRNVNIELEDSKDHNYRDIEQSKVTTTDQDIILSPQIDDKTRTIMTPSPAKEKSTGQVKNINDLKKVLPKVKILNNEVSTLKELSKLSTPSKQNLTMTNSEAKEKLNIYCRTCAGLKIPLVDIFGEKGVQMRLNQQMKHLEDISQHGNLSTHMCMDCIWDLKMSYKFFMQIKKAEVKLKSIYASLNIAPDPVKADEKSIRLVESQKSENADKIEITTSDGKSVIKEFAEQIEVEKSLDHNSHKNLDVSATNQNASVSQSDYELVEEIDNDDPAYGTFVCSDDELEYRSAENSPKKNKNEAEPQNSKPAKGSSEKTSETIEIDIVESNKDEESQCAYEFDESLNTYVRIESNKNESNNIKNEPELQIDTNEEIENDEQNTEMNDVSVDNLISPNNLKRKAPSLNRESVDSVATIDSVDSLKPKSMKDSNIQKLMAQNSLNISSSDEHGIMYVTVKGSKPNELLLVKVKKMEKTGTSSCDKKEDVKSPIKKIADMKPVEKVLRSLPQVPSKKRGIREAIIEEQIELYKKKREKVLGGSSGLPNALKFEDGAIRFVNPINYNDDESNSMSRMNTNNGDDESERRRSFSEESVEKTSADKKKEHMEKLSRVKKQWMEQKLKKEALQQELDESYNEGTFERLSSVIGGSEKALQDFQEYLRLRKIVISKLQDEDILSLYEERHIGFERKKIPDPNVENTKVDEMGEAILFDCDYCLEIFSSHDLLEEHLKIHDYKILFFCEDCGEEFSTNKAKRIHNITCLKKLVCKYCDFMLESKGKKRQHEQKHCDVMYGQLCDVCGEKFKHQGTLDQHIKTQHMSWEKIFDCPKCPKKFAFKQKLSFHLKTVHTTMRAYLCEDCGADFKNPASLRHHRIRKHQPTGNKKECPVCHKLVPFYSLSKHMYTHKAYSIQCPHCDKMFKNSSTLKQHVRIHEDQRQYRCDTCGVGFNRRDGLRLHMRVHQKTDSRALKECSCQICSEKFPNHSMLVIHRNRVHKDGKQYTCHICNRSMLSTRSLEWHMSHIHNETPPGNEKDDSQEPLEKKRVSCNHCDKTFKTEMILRTHIKNTHMEKNPVKCLDCELTFTSEVRLRHHMMVSHNRLEGTLTCPRCPKRFVNQLRLKTHMISHSEDRPYTCEKCGFNLKTKIQLIKHHQNRHSSERPLKCRYCTWRCKQVSALVCHERTHTNERPYACIVCKQRFKYLGDKNKHERRHEILGGSGFKRIVAGRIAKSPKVLPEAETSSEDHEISQEMMGGEQEIVQEYETIGELTEENFEEHIEHYDADGNLLKYETGEIDEEYENAYGQDYEETSREASEATEVILNMEDTTVYTEEVTAEDIENIEGIETIASAETITDEIMEGENMYAPGTLLHLRQDDGQIIPVMITVSTEPTDSSSEVSLATASIMLDS